MHNVTPYPHTGGFQHSIGGYPESRPTVSQSRGKYSCSVLFCHFNNIKPSPCFRTREFSFPNTAWCLNISWTCSHLLFAVEQLPCYAAHNAHKTQRRNCRAGKAWHRVSLTVDQSWIPYLGNCFADSCIRTQGSRAYANAEGALVPLPECESGRRPHLAVRP